MNIIIYYQHITREYKSCLKLKEALEHEIEGAKASVYSIDFEYFKSLKDHKNKKVDLVFMPWLEFRDNYYYLMPFLEKNPNLKAVNLHHEQVGSQTSCDVLIPKDKILHNNVYHFCWGEFFAGELKKIGISEKVIKINGNIRTDQSIGKLQTKEELALKYGYDSSKQWILFAESRDWVWTFEEANITEIAKNSDNTDDFRDGVEILKNFLLKTYEDFRSLPDKFFEKYEIIYRPHPGTVSPVEIDSRVRVISKHPIYDWINACDVYMCSTSTSIFEAEMMGKPVMICERKDFPDKYQMFGLEKYYHIESITEFTEKDIKKALEQTKKPIYIDYIGKCDGKSIERTVNITKDILNSNDIKMEYIKVPKKFFRRKKLFEFVTKVVVKLGLLEKIKYPRSAYRERRDIPFYKNNTNQ